MLPRRQEQRVFTVYADKQLYKDLWDHYHTWLRTMRHIPGLYGLHCNMPITPRAIAAGVAMGGNSLGLEDTGNRTLGSTCRVPGKLAFGRRHRGASS